MTDIRIIREAEVELREAVAYYESKAQGLGIDFGNEIEKALQTIAEQPDRWPLRKDETRRYLGHLFPYLIVYSCEKGQVWVVAFAHCKRRPAYWQNRMRDVEQ